MGLDASVVTLPEIEVLLAEKYDLGPAIEILPLSGGDNHCYRVLTAAADAVLKEMSANGMNHPELEPGVCACLARAGIPTAEFYPTRGGEYVWELRGKSFHLQGFIPGRIYARNTAPEWLLRESAGLLGRIHTALAEHPRLPDGMGVGFYQSFNPDWLRESYLRSAALAEAQAQADLAEDARFRLSCLPWLESCRFDFPRLTCRNTHGDYRVQQLICAGERTAAVIDLSAACVHPILWEVIRSYSFADPACAGGAFDRERFKQYVADYRTHGGRLTAYDLARMPDFYLYQLLRTNYIQQALDADPSGKAAALDVARWSTRLCRWLAEHGESLAAELVQAF